MNRFRSLLCAALLLACTAAGAQVTFYEHDNYGGRRVEVGDTVADFGAFGFNDRASSAVVREGQWQVCDDAYFRGRCVTLSRGSYPSLGAMGLNDRVSSARPVGGPIVGPGGPGSGGRGARIALFDGSNLSGRSIMVENPIENLERFGFNDRAQSAIVYEGRWVLCEHEEFRGDCLVFQPGRYPDLSNLTGRLSSLRPEGYGPPPGPGPGPGAGRARAILYEGPNFSGRQLVIDRNRLQNLDGTGFNDRASSLRVERGYWMFCSDANFDGECRTFGPGDYPGLPPGLNNRISSGRRISDQYPYNQPPNWDRYAPQQ